MAKKCMRMHVLAVSKVKIVIFSQCYSLEYFLKLFAEVQFLMILKHAILVQRQQLVVF